MKLTGQRKRVYEFLKDHPESTTAEIDNALNMRRSSMRISEINREYREEHYEDLIVNCGKTRSNEVKKCIRKPITKTTLVSKIDEETRTVRMVPVTEEV